jgi:NADPH:quinone reductase-like Zn-dependent oxidoreductase
MGAKVIAVSKEEWMRQFGAEYVIADYDRIVEEVRDITSGKMADVVVNSLGVKTWDSSLDQLALMEGWYLLEDMPVQMLK